VFMSGAEVRDWRVSRNDQFAFGYGTLSNT
jgi:hypothetical protein